MDLWARGIIKLVKLLSVPGKGLEFSCEFSHNSAGHGVLGLWFQLWRYRDRKLLGAQSCLIGQFQAKEQTLSQMRIEHV